MTGNVVDAGSAATTVTFGSESETGIAPASENPHEWLFNAAHVVLGKEAGFQLAQITGYPASSCYAYVARDPAKRRRPPEHFTRTLIHRSDDARFFIAFMHGCTAPWWRDFQRCAALGRAVLELTKEE